MAKRISEHLKYLQGPITDGERESGRALTKAMVTALLGSWSLMVEWQEAFSNEELFELAPYLPDEWETLLCR
jgi:hypothetical protein